VEALIGSGEHECLQLIYIFVRPLLEDHESPESHLSAVPPVALSLLVATTLGASPAWGQHAFSGEPKFAYYIAEIGRAAGVEPLWLATPLPPEQREMRAWVGFGLFAPETFTQITSDGHSVHGRRIFWWTAATDSAAEAAMERDSTRISNRELYENLRATAGCGPIWKHDDYEMCAVELAPKESWAGILAQLDSLGVGTLPDARTLSPPAAMGLDGWGIVVEVRDGSSYSTYSYWMPDENAPQPEVRRAAQIARVLAYIGYRK
jgi:hypothetical protein